jgi:hypothetical protein
MLRANDELVLVAWMLEVVNDVGHDNVEDVKLFDLSHEVAALMPKEEVHRLQRVDDVLLVVVLVLSEVSLRHLLREIKQCFATNVILAVKIVLLEELVNAKAHGLVTARA